MYFVILLLVIIGGASSQVMQFDKRATERIEQGKTALDTLSRDAHTSPCWHTAVGNLVSGCRDIEADDVARSRFAVQLTNCHLAKSGFDTYPCTSAMSIVQCTSSMSTIAFNSYTNFYVSSENICYYLQSEYFQNKTEEKINKLYNEMSESTEYLHNLNAQTNTIATSLEESVTIQREITNSMSDLYENVEHTKSSVRTLSSLSDEIKSSVEETLVSQDKMVEAQQFLIAEQQASAKKTQEMVLELQEGAEELSKKTEKSLTYQEQLLSLQTLALDGLTGLGRLADESISKQRELLGIQKALGDEQEKLTEGYQVVITAMNNIFSLQNMLMSEFLDVHALIFYSSATLLSFLLTSTEQTARARLYLLFGLPVCYLMERLLLSTKINFLDISSLQDQLWFIRTKIFPIFAILVLFRAVWKYSDTLKLLQVNNTMMEELLESNKKIIKMYKAQKMMSTMGLWMGEEEGEVAGKGECARTRFFKKFRSGESDRAVIVVNDG